MTQIRPFSNLDPPAVAAIWQRCAEQPGLTSPVSVDVFERLIFSRLYFPESRLFLAFEDSEPVGFAHAAFGPNQDRTWISKRAGVVCMLLVCPEYADAGGFAEELLAHCERFLIDQGAEAIQGGAAPPLTPFYAGLYGGSLPPGILTTDEAAQAAFTSAGYDVVGRTSIQRRSLEGFRPAVDRRMMQIRRSMELNTIVDPAPRDWWEASAIGEFDLTRFELTARRSRELVASLTVRDMGPPSPDLPGPAAGILDLEVAEDHRRQGVATFLLGEAFKQLAQQGIGSVEAHVPTDDPAGNALYAKLGFQPAAEAVRYRKEINQNR